MTAVSPPDVTAHLDNLLMAEVTSVNNELGRYVLRFLDADARRGAPLSTDDERALGDRLAAVAQGVRARAARREQDGEPLRLVGQAVSEVADG